MTEFVSGIYRGGVTHKRLRPLKHALSYRIFMFYLDLVELPKLDNGGLLFGYNRPALFSFYDRDHGARDGSDLSEWVQAQLTKAGISIANPRIRVFCLPRLLGYVFNPLSIIFCYDDQENLRAVLYEVKNTFGEQHGYLFPVQNPGAVPLYQHCDKGFYVSPFMDMKAEYHFTLTPPKADFNLLIRQTVTEGDQLLASWTGNRQPWSAGELGRCFWLYPLVTFKIITAIHWHGLLLWLKGARYHKRPTLPSEDVTFHHEN
jgi:DUF1365 family protein